MNEADSSKGCQDSEAARQRLGPPPLDDEPGTPAEESRVRPDYWEGRFSAAEATIARQVGGIAATLRQLRQTTEQRKTH